jgi:phage tail sheath protein FI
MAPSYLSPGVYVEEVDRGTKPIEAVGTAVAAFVGYTEKAADPRSGGSLVGRPTLVTNWSQYTQSFGAFVEGAFLPESVWGYFNNGGTRAFIVSVKTLGAAADGGKAIAAKATVPSADKSAGVLEITAKAGGPSGNQIQVSVKPEPAKEGAEPTFALSIKGDGQTENFTGLNLKKGDKGFVETAVKTSKLVEVKVVAKDATLVPAGDMQLSGGKVETKAVTLKDYEGELAARTGLGGIEAIPDVTMIVAPDLMTAYKAGELDLKGVQAVQTALVDFAERTRYVFAILDCPPGLTPQEVYDWRMTVNYDTTRAALYYPWVEVADPMAAGKTHFIPPSGLLAGLYARVDDTRGVHKAPANEIVRGALGLELNVTKGEQDMLNPHGINCIRSFPGRGLRVWGARTLSSDPAWRYINVRRLFSMIEASLERGTQWAVFEPNDYTLWARLSRDIGSFLKVQWLSGALFGRTPEEAFYVKCDEELNPRETRDLGQLIVEIGIAPVKPAEFLIIRISQWAPEGGA